ncbi:MAG: Transcriptional regulator, PadR family, partial [uncultured Nocardioidaceae bacterium]
GRPVAGRLAARRAAVVRARRGRRAGDVRLRGGPAPARGRARDDQGRDALPGPHPPRAGGPGLLQLAAGRGRPRPQVLLAHRCRPDRARAAHRRVAGLHRPRCPGARPGSPDRREGHEV